MSAEPRILRVGEEPPPLRSDDDRPTKTKPKRKAAAGRFQTFNAFADATLADLGRAEICVWLLLWRDTKADGLARTSQADLARRAGIGERTARWAIGRLRCAGLLTVARRGGIRQGPSAYRVSPLRRPE